VVVPFCLLFGSSSIYSLREGSGFAFGIGFALPGVSLAYGLDSLATLN
jgi:hypothetical protein